MGSPPGPNKRLLWLGLAWLGAALLYEFIWLSRQSFSDAGAVFAVRRLGLKFLVPRPAYEAFACVSTLLAIACVVWAFLAVRMAFGRQPGDGSPRVAWRLPAAGALLLLVALPVSALIGWVDGHIKQVLFYDAGWFRRMFFKDLGVFVPPQLFWLAALLALGAWLLLRPSGPWAERLSRILEALERMPRWVVVVAACAVVTGAAVALSLAVFGGEAVYVDAHGFLFQGKMFSMGRLWAPLPVDREFFDPRRCPQPMDLGFVFLKDRWFYCGLPLAPGLYALGILAGCPWLVAPLLGGATVLAAYFLAKECFGRTAALLALPFCVGSFWLIINCTDYLTHVPCMVPVVLFMVAGIKAVRRASWRWAVLAGVALGLAANARPVTAAALCFPFAVAWVVWLAREPRKAWLPTVAFVGGFLPFVIGLLAYNAATTGDPFTFAYQLCWRDTEAMYRVFADKLAQDWHWRPAVGLVILFDGFNGFCTAIYHWPIPAAGVVLAAATLLGVWRGTDRWHWPLLLALSCLSLAVAYAFSVDMSVGMGGPRYVFEALPLIAVLGAGTVVALYTRLVRAGIPPARTRATLAILLAFCFVYGVAAAVASQVQGLREIVRHELRVFDKIAASAERPAIVLIPVEPTLRSTKLLTAAVTRNDPMLGGPILYARDLGERNRELIAKFPGRHVYRWDDAAFSLVPWGE